MSFNEAKASQPTQQFIVGDKVEKVGGDYTFVGTVVAVFRKLSGQVRLVVEDDRGVLHVYSEKNLHPTPKKKFAVDDGFYSPR